MVGMTSPEDGLCNAFRTEEAVFADLERLCRRPGFVHAIAHMCMSDNMIGYVGEATAEDMLKLYDPSRLARNEMNALIGLAVRAKIDFNPVDRDELGAYVDEARRLLEEIHNAISAPLRESMRGIFGGEPDAASHLVGVGSGAAMRETIFYGGESAYAFQYRDFAQLRYGADDAWIVKNMGFTMAEAAIVARSAARIIDRRATFAIERADGDFDQISSPLDIFTFTVEHVASLAKLPADVCERVLQAFCYPDEHRNEQFTRVDARNTAAILPMLRREDRYLLFSSVDLYEVLYQAPYFWMLRDKGYQPLASENRGKFTEEFAHARLASVFGSARTLLNVKLMRSSVVTGEIDVLVIFSNQAIVLQAKSKQLTAAARQGNETQIHVDFAAAVQDACDQGMDCAKMLFDPSVRLLGADGQPIGQTRVEKVFVVCLVADHYPALAAQTRQFLKFQPVDKVAPPWVIDVFLLDAMAEMLDSPLQFLNYVDRRCAYAEQVMASHELNILGYHLSHNLFLDEDAHFFHLGDDFGIALELSMLARRDGVAAPWTPPGVLTMLEQTTLGRLIKRIEHRPDPGMGELGFSFLGMSSKAATQLSHAIDEIARRSLVDGLPHDFTMQLQDGVGLTFHTSPFADAPARGALLDHCARRKYAQRANRWFGIVLDPKTREMRFGVMLDVPWAKDEGLELATAHMSRKSNVLRSEFRAAVLPRVGPKVGRNDPCLCGSGKKSKRCCQV